MIKKKNSDLLPEGFKVLLPDKAEKEDFLSRKITYISCHASEQSQRISYNKEIQ